MYDCDAEADIWATAWTPEWKAWCCAHDASGRGCAATTTGTSTSTATTTVTTTLDPNDEDYTCSAPCETGGQTHTCTERIQWASDFLFAGMVDPCDAAHILVLSQCEPCKRCTRGHSGCKSKETDKVSEVIDDATHLSSEVAASEATSMDFRRKFEERPLPRESVGAGPRGGDGVAARLSQFSILSFFGFAVTASACAVVARRRSSRPSFAAPVDGPIESDLVDVLARDVEASDAAVLLE